MKGIRVFDKNLRYEEKALASQKEDASRKAPPSRRAFMAGAAATVGLPWLESMAGTNKAQAAAVPQRLIAWHVPNGAWRETWFPKTFGPTYELSPTLMPLAKIKAKTLVFSQIQNNDGSQVSGSHGLGVAGMLTGVHGSKIPLVSVGISVDQAYAKSLGTTTRIPSLQLGITNRMYADLGHPAIYNGTVSWASATEPLQPTIQPGVVFDKIFEGANPSATNADRVRRKALATSVLDHVTGEAKKLNVRLGGTDRKKLDEYLTGVRAIETQIQNTSTATCSNAGLTKPANTGLVGDVHSKIFTDLMVLALQCDATRVITFMLGNGGASSFTSFPWLGINADHHGLNHSSNGPSLSAIEKWEVGQFAYFCEKLDAISEGTSTMLDNSLVFFSSEIADGSHNQTNKPILLAGSAGGKVKTGTHTLYNGEPQADLFVAMLNALGVPVTTFGTAGTKPLAGVLG